MVYVIPISTVVKLEQEWSVRQAEEQAENNLKHQQMLGKIRCREGLVTIRRRQWEYADMREMCCGKNYGAGLVYMHFVHALCTCIVNVVYMHYICIVYVVYM